MTRARVATVLGVIAVLCVIGTAAVALTRPDDEEAAAMLSVSRGGASFEVPADGWQVVDRDVRIFYADGLGRPAAVVRGPAVFHAGYCGKGSNQAFAGFTEEPLAAWTRALGDAGPVDRQQVEVDGTDATVRRVTVSVDAHGRCSAPEVEVSMIEAGGVRVVLVRDAGVVGDDLLTSLELP